MPRLLDSARTNPVGWRGSRNRCCSSSAWSSTNTQAASSAAIRIGRPSSSPRPRSNSSVSSSVADPGTTRHPATERDMGAGGFRSLRPGRPGLPSLPRLRAIPRTPWWKTPRLSPRITTGVVSTAADSARFLRAIPTSQNDPLRPLRPQVLSADTGPMHLTRLATASEHCHLVRTRRSGHPLMTEQRPESDTAGRSRAEVEGDGLQEEVNAHFDSSASYWDGVYRGDDLQGIIYQQRQAAVLDYVDAARLAHDASVLEIGCGAGHLTMELAERGTAGD